MQTSATIIGNLVSDPELKFLTDGVAKATVGIAVNEYWTDASGQRQEKTSFLNLVAWRQTAEDLCRIGSKGMRMIVIAKPEQRSWEDKETGKNRSTVEFVVSDFGPASRGIESIERRMAPANGGQQATAQKAGVKRPATTKAALVQEEEEPF